jgi:hypothetical protein
MLNKAYEWNVVVKQHVIDENLEPTLPAAGSRWDPSSMESFERLNTTISPGNIVAVVSFGLTASEAYADGGLRPAIQERAEVVVIEWLRTTAFPSVTHPGRQPAVSMGGKAGT